MKQAELAFRQAFSKVLQLPLRRLEVKVEPEISTVDAVCEMANCGYGVCVPWKTREPLDAG